jgi:hypothetical protein
MLTTLADRITGGRKTYSVLSCTTFLRKPKGI